MATAVGKVLLMGGTGVVGSNTARTLRSWYPDLPIAIGARDMGKAQALASAIGGASAIGVDVSRPDLGIPAEEGIAAIAVFFKDETLNSMRFAQARRLPYVSLSSGTFEMGPEVAQYVHAPAAAPIVLASHWLAGAALLPVMHLAKRFAELESIQIGVVLDEQDMGGPAAFEDYERITGKAPAALTVRGGEYTWVSSEAALTKVRSVDGVELPAAAYSPFDIVSLGAQTSARSIRLDLAHSVSASRRAGKAFSTEITIDLTGVTMDGRVLRVRQEIVHPHGQAPVTALGVALLLERMLGLKEQAPITAGLYFTEHLLEPAYYLQRLAEHGAVIEER